MKTTKALLSVDALHGHDSFSSVMNFTDGDHTRLKLGEKNPPSSEPGGGFLVSGSSGVRIVFFT